LLRDQRLVVGRLDGRFTALDADAAGERQEFDPSNTALQGPYVALFQDYVKNQLKWSTDLHYYPSGNVRPWTYVQNRYMDMTDTLRLTMRRTVLEGAARERVLRHGHLRRRRRVQLHAPGVRPPDHRPVSYAYYEAPHDVHRPSATRS